MQTTLTRIDLKNTMKSLYAAAHRRVDLLEIPALPFLMIDGSGKPTGAGFQQAAAALYPVAYLLKFMVRGSLGIDYGVMPMEVIWNVNRQEKRFRWTMMLLQPEWITPDMVVEAVEKARAKSNPTLLDQVRLETLAEGPCAQMLHRGPYEGIDESLAFMTARLSALGYTTDTTTHDIYLNDVRRTQPANLRAIMRVRVMPDH